MLSKLLFNLTAVFLIFYISETSATPAAQPVELQENNDNIHPRARRPYRSYSCNYPYAWQRRECTSSLGPRAWQDVCDTSYVSQYDIEYQNKRGSCPDNKTFCMDTVDAEGKRFIRCVGSTPKERKSGDPQVGSSELKRARPSLDTTQLEFSVKVEDDMPVASVAAVIESECSAVNVHLRMSLCS